MGNSMGFSCIELKPGANTYVVPREEIQAPENFIDPNSYYYQLVDGRPRLKGIVLKSLDWPCKWLSCFEEKGEIFIMTGKPRADKEKLFAAAKELMQTGLSMTKAAERLGLPVGTLGGWFNSERKKKQSLDNELPPASAEPVSTSPDDNPIPYLPVKSDLAPVKCQLIATLLAEYRAEQIDAETALGLTRGILEMLV